MPKPCSRRLGLLAIDFAVAEDKGKACLAKELEKQMTLSYIPQSHRVQLRTSFIAHSRGELPHMV
jgi:hypothetical protein